MELPDEKQDGAVTVFSRLGGNILLSILTVQDSIRDKALYGGVTLSDGPCTVIVGISGASIISCQKTSMPVISLAYLRLRIVFKSKVLLSL